MGEPGAAKYKVLILPRDLAKLRAWGQWAKEHGLLDEFLTQLKTIQYRLTFEADEWGEPKYSLKKLELDMRLGSVAMMNVMYGIHHEQLLVLVKSFQFRRDYPKGHPPDNP